MGVAAFVSSTSAYPTVLGAVLVGLLAAGCSTAQASLADTRLDAVEREIAEAQGRLRAVKAEVVDAEARAEAARAEAEFQGCQAKATQLRAEMERRLLPSLSFRRNLNSPRATESRAGCSRVG